MTAATTAPVILVHDTRRFWRVLLAVVLPLPWLAKGLEYIAHDYGADEAGPTGFLAVLDHTFTLLVVPSVMALTLLARRAAPRLATTGAIVMGGGFLAALAWNTDEGSPGLVAFVLAILIGSVLVGLALWRSRAVPGWAAAAVGLGGATHIFLGFNHVVHGAGLVVLAVGCVAASLALLRLADDGFDLPPGS